MKSRKWIFGCGTVLLIVCLAFTGISAFINRSLPTQSAPLAQLSTAEKMRLAEFFHVRQQLGNAVWPGWGTANIPVIVYNEAYTFLLAYPDPPDGWIKVPQNSLHGGPWELVPNDLFGDEAYYRQALPTNGEVPQAFTVKVGDQWTASMPTQEWMAISLHNQFKTDLPSFIEPVFPYKMVSALFLRGSEGSISLLAHESFHAYEGMVNPEHFEAAETDVSGAESRYPWSDPTLQASWQTELDLLATTVDAETEAEMVDLAQQFLTQRVRRRQECDLDQELIEYESRREWLEGLARYVELEIWRQGSVDTSYEPIPAIWADPDFDGYTTFDKRWSQEIGQIRRMAKSEGDGRFYYSGMAQAVLLDRLMPGWKSKPLDNGIFLEDLLAGAVGY